jgi:glycosyltransferase involved in cell wall biosynthesis
VDWEKLSAVHLWAGSEFGRRVVHDGFGDAVAVYTFNTAALEILRAARERGLFTVMEQTIAPRAMEEMLLAEEQERFPGWDPPRQRGGAADATVEREAEEWALADVITCGSEFVRNSIASCGGPVERCVVVPYGVDGRFSIRRTRRNGGPLRVLSVGEAGLRKGASYALETAKLLRGMAELRWVGPITLNAQARARFEGHMEMTGAVPRSQILPHYEWADVFFLPSVCEGSATVTYEALTCGLPVITTPNAGSMVRNGIDGFVVPVRDTAAMAARLRQLHEDRDLLERMSTNASESFPETSLSAYQARLLRALGDVRVQDRPPAAASGVHTAAR